MKYALITDTHFGARNDSLVFSTFFQKFYENVFFPTLKERNIKSVIHLIINYLFTISQVSQTPSTTGTTPQSSHCLVKLIL